MNLTIHTGFKDGSSLQGHLDIAYSDIVDKLGDPATFDGGDKVDAEWCFTLDGVYCTLYNYKDGVNYNGPEGTPTVDIRDWHIGGISRQAVVKVKQFFAS